MHALKRSGRALPLGALLLTASCHIVAGFDDLVLREDPEALWSSSLSGNEEQAARAVAAVPEHVYAAVEYRGELNWNGNPIASASEQQRAALLQFNTEGTLAWSRILRSDSSVLARAVIADDQGAVVAGAFGQDLDIAGTALVGVGAENLFLAELASTGEVVTARRYGSIGFAMPGAKVSLARDPQGSLVIGGAYVGELDFGCGPMLAQGPVDAYVAKLTDGTCDWSQSLGDSKLQQLESLAVELGGDVVVAGKFAGVLDFGGVQLESGGGIDAFVAKLDSEGNHRWSRRYGDSGGAVSSIQVAVHRLGNVTVAGYFEGTVNFGDGPVTAHQGHDLFVVKLNPNGAPLWTRHYPTNRDPCSLDDCDLDRIGVVTDVDGNLILTGHFRNDVDFGGTKLRSIGATDLFVAKLDVNGNLLWSGRFGNVAAQCEPPACVAVAAVDSARNVILGGEYLGRMDFGQATLPSESDGGAFLVKLAP